MTSSDRPRTPSWLPEVAPAPPRTLDEAIAAAPRATLAIVGAPRALAAIEVRRALEHGLDVIVTGEGMSLEAEIAEKAFASERGLLVLAGDAVIDGTPVGRALPDPRHGGLGIVAADAGAALEAMAAADRGGVGVSHVLVVGPRDLGGEVGGAGALAAIARLASDETTAAIAVVGPADARVARALQHACAGTSRPAVICAFGDEPRRGVGWESCRSIDELTRALARLGVDGAAPTALPEAAQRGAAGTVIGALGTPSTAHEVLGVLLGAGLDVASNVARAGVLPEDVGGHTVVALDAPAARAAWLRSFADDPSLVAALVDLPVTSAGEGAAHETLAALRELTFAARARGGALQVIAARARIGGDRGSAAIERELDDLGAVVATGAAEAARRALLALAAAAGASPDRALLRGRPLSVLTLAADEAAYELASRGIPVLSLAWSPPAGGDARIARLVGLLR